MAAEEFRQEQLDANDVPRCFWETPCRAPEETVFLYSHQAAVEGVDVYSCTEDSLLESK